VYRGTVVPWLTSARNGRDNVSVRASTFSNLRTTEHVDHPSRRRHRCLQTSHTMHARCQLLSGRLSTQGFVVRSSKPTQRTYATSDVTPTPVVKNPLQRRRGGDLGSHLPKNVIPKDAYIPAYPYGDHQLFKQANRGLYGEQMIRFGNNVSKDTETRTRRNWKPNVLSKALYSVALKKKIKLRITAKVLKTMDREGGLDEYLLKDNVARVKELGPMGWALRWTLMQRPEVIDRLRADAAALGLDQATIDKQWPTPQLMAEQKAAQGDLAQRAYTSGLETGEFAETEGQEMWSAEEEEDQSHDTIPTNTIEEKKLAASAATEYAKAVKAAERYLTRGVVDSEEEGLKLAFIRAKERQEAAAKLKENFNKKYLDADFSAEDLQDIRTRFNLPNIKDHTARKIAFNQRRRKEIDDAGGLDAWKATQAELRGHAKRIEEQGGREAIQARTKAGYASVIAEAETAATNKSLSDERREFLGNAIRKADVAIRAKAGAGEDDYVEAMLDEWRGTDGLKSIFEQSRQETGAGGDAWGALVNSSNRPTGDEPRA
jgi:large subunit ribosomal protein L28